MDSSLTDQPMLVAGDHVRRDERSEVQNPFTGETIATVPVAEPADVDRALDAATTGARQMAALPAAERAGFLERAATLLEARIEEFARLVVAEQGKTLAEARRESERTPELLRLCAAEGRRMQGETLALDGSAGGAGKLGFTLRVPAGVVVAITPFNYPMLLVLHKLGPALAAGNAVVLKPSSLTPLSALALSDLLVEAGFPPYAMQCITGAGPAVGAALCADDRVRAVSFTGSRAAGAAIASVAGVKKLCLELGANCPVIVLADADLDRASELIASGGFANAGQVCISAQRVLAVPQAYDELLERLRERSNSLTAGDPLDPVSSIGPLITRSEAERVAGVITDAVASGARVVSGGGIDGAVHQPTIVSDVDPSTRFFREELFGPAVGVTPVERFEDAVRLANDTPYGLAASIFTRDIDNAVRFIRLADVGNVHINWSPLWRADSMPYGGLKQSGFGKEGPKYAIESMSDMKTVVIHPNTPS